MNKNASFPPIHFFRPGRHSSMSGQVLEFSAADLSACAAAYDPAIYQAPIVVGHPAVDAPAYGWVSGIEDRGAELYASADQVESQFADMVRAGRFKKVSGAFFPPTHPRNPVPGVWYLKHLGFLGAAAPAVPGLKPVEYALEDGLVTIEFSEPDEPTPPNEKGEYPMSDADRARLAELEAKAAALEAENATLKTRETEFAEAQTRLAEIETTTRRAEIAAFAGGLIKQGRVLPADQAALCAFMESAGADAVIEFGEGDGKVSKPGNAWLREWLGRLPVQVDFAERAPGDGGAEQAAFVAPDGYGVDADSMALHSRAVAHQKAHPGTDYLAAVLAVN